MKFNSEFLNLNKEIELLKNRIDSLQHSYESAKEFTSIFLQCCEKHGIKMVSINTATDLIKACKGWGSHFPESIFADEKEDVWPAIWAVSDEMKIGAGCGNGGQHQAHCARLIEGVYKFKNNEWERVD